MSRDKFDDKRADRQEGDNEEFPGYPHYPAKEDIMSSSSDMERVPLDVENLTPSGKYLNAKQEKNPLSDQPAVDATSSTEEEDINVNSGTDADVTRDDLIALGGTRYSDNDLQNNARTNTVDGEDLDIPGAELDNPNEEIGEEDEENNYYSLGGDRHESLEDDPTAL
ncbi:MAG TPA: hypothetical protein VEB42_09100 [Chitinophagaceae bacterium]|nr:hypothetical protein [Chitinophagaceae bacterium]